MMSKFGRVGRRTS